MKSSKRTLEVLLTGLILAIPGHLRAAEVVKIDGSSTVFPITEAVAEEFQKATGNRVTVGISGTGGGFKKFTRGETDVQNASRPISESEIKAAKETKIEFLEFPIAYDALTVVVNSRNDWAKDIKVSELKKIWEPAAQGQINYFTEAVVGKSKSSRGDYTASEDDNVLVQGVEGDKFALGYMGYSYYEAHKNRLKSLPVIWDEKGKPAVAPSMATVLDGTYNPLSRPLFIYVNLKSLDKPEVLKFMEFYFDNIEKLAKEVNYVPLPASAYEILRKRLADRQKGTAFAGHADMATPVSEILKRTPVP
jgi:phosphate transport system substrate-binding protein